MVLLWLLMADSMVVRKSGDDGRCYCYPTAKMETGWKLELFHLERYARSEYHDLSAKDNNPTLSILLLIKTQRFNPQCWISREAWFQRCNKVHKNRTFLFQSSNDARSFCYSEQSSSRQTYASGAYLLCVQCLIFDQYTSHLPWAIFNSCLVV